LHINVLRFQGGHVCKAHILLYHSSLGLRVINKKEKYVFAGVGAGAPRDSTCYFFFFTLVTGPIRSLSLKLSDTRVCEP